MTNASRASGFPLEKLGDIQLGNSPIANRVGASQMYECQAIDQNFLAINVPLLVRNRENYDPLQYANYAKATRKKDIYQYFTFSCIFTYYSTNKLIKFMYYCYLIDI